MKVYQTISKGLGFVGMVAFLMMSFCTKDNPVQPKIDDNWTISGNVQDGYTGAFLDSAQIVYPDRDGKLKTIVTTAGGSFALPNLPFGNVTVTFKYSKGTTRYTTTVLRIASGDKADALTKGKDSTEFKFRDTSVVVKLFAMSGSVSGIVQTRLHAKAPLVPGDSVPVKITYGDESDVAMEFASPRTFTAVAGANGSFRIDSLPLAPNATLTLLSKTVGGVDFAQKSIKIPDLTKDRMISVGTVVMDMPVSQLDSSSMFKLLYTNFPTKQILPNGTMAWTFSNKPDSIASYAVVQAKDASAASSKISFSLSGNAFTVTPNPALQNGQKYFVSVFVYGSTGGFATDTATVTVKSANAEEVLASNVLTATKQGISGLGLNDSIFFTFAEDPKEAAVYVTHNSGSGTIVDLVTATTSGKQVIIKPKGSWLAATPYAINVSGTLANGTPVAFLVTVTTEGSLDFATSNVFDPADPSVGKNGFIVSDSIVVTANKPLAAANAILREATGTVTIPVIVSVSGSRVVVRPSVVLNFATNYNLALTITSTTGEVKSSSTDFLTISSSFYMLSSNACLGGDPTKPNMEFDVSQAITIVMSEKVKSATATLTSGGAIATSTTIASDEPGATILVKPTDNPIPDNVVCSLTVTTASMNDVRTTIVINGFKTRSGVFIVSSNVLTGDFISLTNVPINVVPWFKMSVAPIQATMKAIISGTSSGTPFDNSITVRGDTLFITPVTSFRYGETVTIGFAGQAVNGKSISETNKQFTIQPAKSIRVVWSNILNANLDGLTDVAVNTKIKVILSVTPKAGSITKDDVPVGGVVSGTIGNAGISVSGDTIIIDPVSNMDYNATFRFTLTGLDVNNIAFNAISIPASPSTFKTSQNVFVVASNLVDANGYPIKTFTQYGTMWIKFSEALSTDKNLFSWGAYNATAGNLWIPSANALASPADAVIIGEGLSTAPNAAIRIGGDTLFITPDNRVSIDYNKKVGFAVTIQTLTGKAKTFEACVQTSPLNLFVKATNTKDANGVMRENFGYRDTIVVVPNIPLDSIIAVHDSFVTPPPPTAFTQIPDDAAGILRSRVRLSANGDTIYYVPSIALGSSAQYGLNFDVHVKNRAHGAYNNNVLGVKWKTTTGIEITEMNLLANAATYRSFKVIGDSVVVKFSKSIDTTWNAPTPFKVNGITGINYTTRWVDLKTVVIKNTDTLTSRNFSTDVSDYSTDLVAHPENYMLTFNVTCTDGEKKSNLAGGNSFVQKVAIKTEYKLALIGSNTVSNHAPLTAIAASETPNNMFALNGQPTLVFSRLLDTARIRTDAASQYMHYIRLVKTGTPATLLNFSVQFSNEGRTITMVPAAALDTATEYDIMITNIPAVGLKQSDVFNGSGTPEANSILSTGNGHDFKTVPANPIIITSLVAPLFQDTVVGTSLVGGNRYGYSPALAASGVQADGMFRVRIQKPAWNAQYLDSVSGYQVQVRNSTAANWYILSSLIPARVFSTFYPSDSLYITTTINVTGTASAYNALEIADFDGPGGSVYTNGPHMLNDSTVAAFQIRPFKANGAVDTSYGQWSNTISFVDNVAPGDSNYTAHVNLTTNLAVASFNRIANPGTDSTNYIDVEFPEDMTNVGAPAITFYNGNSIAGTAMRAASDQGSGLNRSRWINARTYRIHFVLTDGVNYTFANSGYYFKVTATGLRDFSGVTLQPTGVAPAPVAANGTTYAAMGATTASTRGNNQVGPGSGAPVRAGYYQVP